MNITYILIHHIKLGFLAITVETSAASYSVQSRPRELQLGVADMLNAHGTTAIN